MLHNRGKGFTLIELLIVVAIIAILAAIAVPNFLEAQIRARVTRAKADMRSIATALQSYRADYNRYPYPIWIWEYIPKLTTPISYIGGSSGEHTSRVGIFTDYFFLHSPAHGYYGNETHWLYPYDLYTRECWGITSDGRAGLNYFVTPNSRFISDLGEATENTFRKFMPGGSFQMRSCGPNYTPGPGDVTESRNSNLVGKKRYQLFYDPTNGTVSRGMIMRIE